jgi:predicted amino acid racemase
MKLFMPRIEISLPKIRDNARMLSELYGKKGISIMGVSKAVLGEPFIVKAMVQGGVRFIADSRIENIEKMKAAGISTQFVLLRTSLSQAESVVRSADISLNTELDTLKKLSYFAEASNKIHQVIVMVELGDLREGVLPIDLSEFIRQSYFVIPYKNCWHWMQFGLLRRRETDADKNMHALSELFDVIEKEFHLGLTIISGGNSANYEWYKSTKDVGNINNLRLGESILLGLETVNRKQSQACTRVLFSSLLKLLSPRKSHLFHLERSVKMLLEMFQFSKIREFTSGSLLLWESRTSWYPA